MLNNEFLEKNDVLDVLRNEDVLLDGHFLLSSGKHSRKYLQCAKIFKKTKISEFLCKKLADSFSGFGVEVVIGPALGAVIMAYEVSRWLNAENYFAEREAGKMTLRRGFKVSEGQKVLLVEDVVTTGGSLREVMDLLRVYGADIVGVGCIIDRTGGEIDFGVPFKSVYSTKVECFDPEVCPLCKTDLPLVKPGSKNLS